MDTKQTIRLSDEGEYEIDFIGISTLTGALVISMPYIPETGAVGYEETFSSKTLTKKIIHLDAKGVETVYEGYTGLASLTITYEQARETTQIMLRRE